MDEFRTLVSIFYQAFHAYPGRSMETGAWAIDGPHDQAYHSPRDTTEEDVNNLMRRSLAAGRNLFLEEWEPWTPDPNVEY